MPEDNLYELLQVEPDADLPEIRAAYRRLIFQHHPDRNAGVDAQEMTQRLIRAYELPSDPDRRAAYDWQLFGEPGLPPGAAEQPDSRPLIVVESRSPIFGGLSRTAGLAATGAVLVAAIIVIGVMIATGGGDSNNANQTVQVVAPVATPNLTPPISTSSGESTGGSTSVTPTATPNPTFLFESGEAFIRNGDFHRAIDEFTRAIELIPSYGFGYQVRGDSFFQLAQLDMAIQDYDRAI
jgi:tetratricopeptide (TPR) repeat protein